MPLKSSKGVLGVLSLFRSHGDGPSAEDRETLDAICSQIAIAIENVRLQRELGSVEAQGELDRMKAELISTISHELRTPLGFIKGYATTLLREDISVDDDTRKEFLRVIDEESDRLQRMIHELLDASRLQAGRLEVNRRAVPLKQFLEGALHKVTPSLSQRGDDLVVQLPRSDSEVLIDPGRIEQVLHNLVDNAARYSASGSSIRIGATLEHDLAVVTVEDSGDGIPAHETARIFDPFFRGENARRRGAHGTGLGLAICRGIIDSHGGRLWVDSSPGKGSTFSFALSLVDGGDAESPASEEAMISPDRESM